jgi:site-specific recombinase XerD
MKGAPARATRELAGHRDLRTTARHMHLSPAAMEAGVRLLEERQPMETRGDDEPLGS